MEHAEAVAKRTKAEPQLKNCPSFCPIEKKRDLYRQTECDQCPLAKERRIFKEEADELWSVWGLTFDFDNMSEMMYWVFSLEGVPADRLTVKNSALVAIVRREKAKFEARHQPMV